MIHIAQIDQRDPQVADQIRDVLALAYAQEAALMPTERLTELDETVEEIQGSRDFFLGAVQQGLLIGYLSIGPDDEPNQISIATLVVHPAHQRRGVGRMLLQEALRRSDGIVVSVSTGASNLAALSLYREFGFIEYRYGTIGPESHALVKLRTGAP